MNYTTDVSRFAVFIVAFYSAAIIILALILHFGVQRQVSDPSKGIRVAFLVACLIGGLAAGAGCLVFHRGAKVIIAPVAGFLFAVTVQSVKDDGLIGPIGYRYVSKEAVQSASRLMLMPQPDTSSTWV